MRVFLRRFPTMGGLLFFALLGAAALAGPQYFRGNTATHIVTTTNDSGPGSLRQALADAQDGDTIQFDLALNGQTINLTSAELAIDKNITISGPGSGQLTVSRSSGTFRIFHVVPNHTVIIQGLTMSGGIPPGGGIFNEQATLTIDNCTVSNNVGSYPGPASGGGISNSGTLTITHSTISGNYAPNSAGGISNDGIGMLTIIHSTISGNAAGYGTGGGISNDGRLTITDSAVSNNRVGRPSVNTSGLGGGISNSSSGTLMISNSTISDNRNEGGQFNALGGGIGSYGSLTISNSIISHNYAYLSGGGIFTAGPATITFSTISGNSAANFFGGGISNSGMLTITYSTVSSNETAGAAGGINNGGTLTILSSTVSDNTASGSAPFAHVGGAISSSGSLAVSNSTISRNFALGNAGGIFNGGTLAIGHSTFSNNWTQNGDGGGIVTDGANAIMEIGDTVLKAGTSGGNISGTGPVTSHGYNLSSDNGGGFLTATGDQTNTDPMLGPLQDNGGPTFTHYLLAGSPAINAGDPNFTPPPLYDQRGLGYARVFNGRMDIGALEAEPTLAVSLPITTFDTSVPINTVIIEPVLATNTGLNYIGFQADFTFDQRVVTFAPPFVQAAGLTGGGNWNISASILPGPGPIRTFRLSAFSLDFTPLSGSGTLLNLRMLRVSSTPGNTSPLVWAPPPNNFVFIDGDLNTHVPDQNNGLITITGKETPTPTPPASATPTATATATPTATVAPSATPTPGSLAVSLPIVTFDASVPVGTVFLQPVLTTNIDASLSYIGFQGDFTYDSTVVTFASPFVQAAGLTGVGNWNVSANILPGPGPIRTFRFSAFSLDFTPLSGSGTLFNLRMLRVGGTPGTTSPLVWQPDPNNFVFIDSDLNTHVPIQNNGLIIITGPGTPTPSPPPSPTPTATPCGNTVFSENFDGVVAPALPPGWVTANAAGAAPMWVTSTTTPDTAPNDAFIDDPATVSDKLLDTPNIAISSAAAQVSFRNFYFLESTFDGGVLEVSSPNINAGAFTDITAAAVGGSFVTGAYSATISTAFMSPIAGRMAWSGNAGGYINTVANLGPNVAGQTIKLRFRMASDNSVSATGWRVDTIRVADGTCPSPTPTASPSGTPTPTPTPPAKVSLPIDTFDTSVPIDTVIIEPVLTTNIDSLNYVGFQGDFTFDERVVTFAPPFVQAAGLTGGGNWNVSASILPGPGPIRTFRFSAFSVDFTPLSGSGTLVNLRMLRVSGTPGDMSPLVWQPAPNNFMFIDGDLNTSVPDQTNGLITITGTGTPTPSPTPTATATATPTATPPPVKVSLPNDTWDTSVPIATIILRPVTTTQIDTSLNYVGFQGDFFFNETVCTFPPPFVNPAGLTGGGNWNVTANILPGPGPIRTFRLSAFSLDFTPLSGSGTLFNLRMLRVSSTPGNTCPLVWAPPPNNFVFIDGDLNTHVPDQNNGLITITGGTPTPSATATATATCPPVITQSTSQAITTPAPLCIHPPFPSFNEDNHYWRAFNMQHFVGGAEYTVSSVSFGVFSGSATVIVRLYANNGAPFPTGFPGSLTQIGTTTLSVTSGQGGTVVTTPLVATAPVGTNELVMELYVPELAGFLFPGANTAPETGPSYWSSVNSGGCGSTPGVISSHLVFNVYGACGQSTPTPTPDPTPSIAPPTHFAVTAPGFVGQGAPFSFTVTAQDQFNNTVPDYAGTVHFTSTDSTAELPMDSTLLGGTGTFQATLHMAAEQTITATDTSNASLTGTSHIIFVEPFEPPTPTIPSTPSPTPTPVTPTPTPTLTPSPTPTPCTGTIVWSENFDELPPGPIGSGWVISTTDPDTPPNDAFCPDLPGVSGAVLDFSGVSIPSASTVLRFRNNFNLEFSGGVYWDGGVLEVSSPNISGGAFLDITDSHVGGSFASGGYTGIIEGAAGNPLAGRLAWGGNSGGYIDSVINLGPNLVGQTVTLRFLFGSDGSGGAPGWRVDTMTITDGVCTTPTPTPTPGSATHFAVVAPSEVSQNLYFDFTVTALDQFSNTATNYAGTVHFTTTSAGFNHLPADSTLTSGTGTFSATLSHTGNQKITATDLGNASITGVSNLILVVPKGPASPTPIPSPSPTASATPSPIPARPINLSTRVLVQTGDSVGIGGFIITPSTSSGPNGPSTDSGTNGKQVLVRAIGPSLSSVGVPNFLADPVMELHGPAGFTTIVNDNWRDTQEAEILATGIPPSNNLESAIVVTLDPGNYTAIVKGKDNTSGVGLVEVYDLDPETSQLANISTRAFVGAGGDVVIGGFILGGGDNTHIDIFGLGPSLAGSGVSGVLADPTLELRNGNGALLGSNDNCDAVSIHPLDPAEACIEVTLPPGAYTAILAGKNGGTGIGLVEIYNLN